MVPYLVFDTYTGSQEEAEYKLASALARAHDALCAMNAESMHIFGLLRCACAAFPFMSFSTRSTDPDGKQYCESIVIVRLPSFVLTQVEGLLGLYKFIEHAKTYGSGPFRASIEKALAEKI